MEAAEVDEGVGAEEEVGDDGGNGIELGCGRRRRASCQWWGLSHSAGTRSRRALGQQTPTNEDKANGNDIGKHVATDGLAVPPVALPEEADERIELVLAETLQRQTQWGQEALPGTWDGSAVVAPASIRARAELGICPVLTAASSLPQGCSQMESSAPRSITHC